ncbi:MAG: hypothetical protein M3Q31_17790 [Actinomycetota bacterium]|nr:hypothetical protein [Actinomycetota bacterium]
MIRDWREGLGRLETVEPSPGLWERARAQAAEGPIEAVSPIRHRLATIVVAAVVAVAGIAGLFIAFKGQPPPSNHVLPGMANYRDPIGNWEITYPAWFSRGTLPSAQPRVTVSGIWIANFTPTFEHTGGPFLTQLPNDGVFVGIYQLSGGPAYLPTEPDSPFPVSIRVPPGSYGMKVLAGSFGTWRTTVVANGEPYSLMTRVGRDATRQDRVAAAHIIASLRFLPLRQGTAIGQQQHLAFYVLAPRDSYPVGSITRFDTSDLPSYGTPFPFYLVHVPRGYYALSWQQDLKGGYQGCDVTYDVAAQYFSCPNGARWALDGTVVAKPGPKFPDDPLQVLIVRISLDGHVLVSPNVFMHDTKLDLRLTGQ